MYPAGQQQPSHQHVHQQNSSAPTIVAAGYPTGGSFPPTSAPPVHYNGPLGHLNQQPHQPQVISMQHQHAYPSTPTVISQPPPPAPTPTAFDPNYPRNWSTGPCDCVADEESCWWGTWCCCILYGRNVETFGVGQSTKNVYIISAWIFFCVICLLFIGPIFFWVVLLGSIAYTVQRARMRSAIRGKLNIVGNIVSDCVYHLFFKQCAVCQEAREAKLLNLKKVDYISGQDMNELISLDDEAPPASLKEVYVSLSKTSQLIVQLSAIFILFITVLLAVRRPSYLVILMLVFLQPALILYFVYWRQRRQYVQMDYVVKLFVVGFFMSTTQSIVFEEILQTVITVGMFILFLVFNGTSPSDNSSNNGGDNKDSNSMFTSFFSSSTTYPPLTSATTEAQSMFWESMQVLRRGNTRPLLHTLLLTGQEIIQYFASTSTTNTNVNVSTDYAYTGASVHPFPALSNYVSSAFVAADAEFSFPANANSEFSPLITANNLMLLAQQNNGTSSSGNDDVVSSVDRGVLEKNVFLLVLYLFLLAFVVAAGVEETMKHFVVRCCRFPQNLKEPQTMMVYLLTAALGFATAENIEYVLGAKTSPIAGVSLFVGELFILFIRILMPIHLICAVLQAAQMSKRDTGIDPTMPLIKLLFPAIFLHGSFDFFLFLVSALQYVYRIENIVFDLFTMIFPFVMTIAGIIWAKHSFGQVEAQYRSEWRPLQDGDQHEQHSPETSGQSLVSSQNPSSSASTDSDTVEIQMNVMHPTGHIRQQQTPGGYIPPTQEV